MIIALELLGPARLNAFSRSKRAGNVYMLMLAYLLVRLVRYVMALIIMYLHGVHCIGCAKPGVMERKLSAKVACHACPVRVDV